MGALQYLNSVSSGKVYYCANNGNDANPGTISEPITIHRIRYIAQPGDTFYIRGGTYYAAVDAQYCWYINANGTANKYIKVWNYPGESPVIDCSTTEYANNNAGFRVKGSYLHIKGIEVKNLPQQINPGTGFGYGVNGFSLDDAHNCIVENLSSHDHGGSGFTAGNNSYDNLIVNCDSYRNYDVYGSIGGISAPGGNADGFHITISGTSGKHTLIGCRAWWNSDDGYDFFNCAANVELYNCQAFWNGNVPGTFTPAGDGNGFKGGDITSSSTEYMRKFVNCIAFENNAHGFDKCINPPNKTIKHYLANCTSFGNGIVSGGNYSMDTNAQDFFKNCIGLNTNGTAGQDLSTVTTDISSNSWDLAVTAVPSDEFISISSVGMDGARGINNALPVTNFLRLKSTSRYRNVGIDIGLPYNEYAPDLGAYEYAV